MTNDILLQALKAAQDGGFEAAIRVFNDNAILSFGVESARSPFGRTLEYINLGDTYTTTIAYDGHFLITSWGDWVEQEEMDYADENDLTYCNYCGDLSLDDCICDNCGSNLG